MKALYHGQRDVVNELLASGIELNESAGDFTPLHESAASGRIEFAKLLLETGADVNAQTTEGKTPLDYARERNRDEMVELLSQHVRDE
jgi:ankyrin repeat protein